MDKITALDKEISDLRNLLNHKQDELFALQQAQITQQQSQNSDNLQDIDGKQQTEGLPKWAIERYSRQILLQDIGVPGQKKLLNARVLIVGAGGLASTAALYLAGAGVGEIGIVDYDTVDLTNLHRQILHRECDQNVSKAKSAANSMKNLNSRIKVTPYNVQLDSSNALQITCNYDIVLDCTDNVPTRYMLNDVCVLNKLPLISGSALKMEGQLTIYGYRNIAEDFTGPCYRCLFPTPPPADTIGSCSSVGVAGPVPGVIGCLQALEAIKYIVGHPHSKLLVERMLLFDGEDMVFRTVKLRSKTSNCAACSDHPTVTKLLDYESFCKTQAKEKDLDLQILPPKNRITAQELQKLKHIGDGDSKANQRHLVIDVRSEPEFGMCRIDGAVNYPIDKLHTKTLESLLHEIRRSDAQVIFVCRRGNDSQIAAKKVLDLIEEEHKSRVRDLSGGLHAWAEYVDHDFPVY